MNLRREERAEERGGERHRKEGEKEDDSCEPVPYTRCCCSCARVIIDCLSLFSLTHTGNK